MWNQNWRDDIWDNADKLWDMVIIGGGITGAGVLSQATQLGLNVLLVEQNANMALQNSAYGYVLENGRIVMEDSCENLMASDDIKEFYMGVKDEGVRGRRRWKKRKTWR